MALVFKSLILEIVQAYPQCIRALPLEYLEPQFLLKYLPPAHDVKASQSIFWKTYHQINKSFTQTDLNHKLYASIALEYINDLQMPGKALIILQEAA